VQTITWRVNRPQTHGVQCVHGPDISLQHCVIEKLLFFLSHCQVITNEALVLRAFRQPPLKKGRVLVVWTHWLPKQLLGVYRDTHTQRGGKIHNNNAIGAQFKISHFFFLRVLKNLLCTCIIVTSSISSRQMSTLPLTWSDAVYLTSDAGLLATHV
jgi:hypothetical protein